MNIYIIRQTLQGFLSPAKIYRAAAKSPTAQTVELLSILSLIS